MVAAEKEWKNIENTYLIHFIPTFCKKILSGNEEKENLEYYSDIAFKKLHEEMKTLFEEVQHLKQNYMTFEEKNTFEKLHALKERELIGYYKSLKFIKKYLKTSKKTLIKHALDSYCDAQKTFKALLAELTGFIAINMHCRGKIKRFC